MSERAKVEEINPEIIANVQQRLAACWAIAGIVGVIRQLDVLQQTEDEALVVQSSAAWLLLYDASARRMDERVRAEFARVLGVPMPVPAFFTAGAVAARRQRFAPILFGGDAGGFDRVIAPVADRIADDVIRDASEALRRMG